MIKLSKDRTHYIHPEVKELKVVIKRIVNKLHIEPVFYLNAEYFINHFFETKIEELDNFFSTNQITSAKKYMEYLVEFTRRFFTNIYRTMKSNYDDKVNYDHMDKEKAARLKSQRAQAKEIYKKHIEDVDTFMDILKKVRKILNEPTPRKLKIDHEIIPTAKDVFLEDFEMKDNFIRTYLTYILLIMNNECYIDLITENVPRSILKLQRVIKARL
jgi:hypothetical protein